MTEQMARPPRAVRSPSFDDDEVFLEDASGRFALRGRPQKALLTRQRLHLTPLGDSNVHAVLIFDDIIGAEVVETKPRRKGAGPGVRLVVYAYPRVGGCCRKQRRRATHLRVDIDAGKDIGGALFDARSLAELWCNTVNTVASGKPLMDIRAATDFQIAAAPAPRRYLVFVNPFSGARKALRAYNNVVLEVFAQAHVEPLTVVTERAGHAQEYVRDLDAADLQAFDAVVAVGGDGMLYEVVNGIAARPDAAAMFAAVPLGVIKGGTGNGLAVSILKEIEEELDVLSSTLQLLKAPARNFDLSLVTHGAEDSAAASTVHDAASASGFQAATTKVNFLSLTWGIISDIDIESERLRCLGPLRNDVYALMRLINVRRYPGKLWIYEAGSAAATPEPKDGAPTLAAAAAVDLPPLSEPLPLGQDVNGRGWRLIGDTEAGESGEFISVMVLQCAWIAHDVQAAPMANCGDTGVYHIVVLRGRTSSMRLINMFLEIEDAAHLRAEHADVVEYYKALAYRIVPETDRGIYSLDGEVTLTLTPTLTLTLTPTLTLTLARILSLILKPLR
mmetsp:Transcript_41170/g.129049  ORF Transcript_41170/g.129049 Transcript_41170/m.129049 type:complete len:561 (-) Transcript_41170:172-1854(-)